VQIQVCTNHGFCGTGEATMGKNVYVLIKGKYISKYFSQELLGQKSSNLNESFLI
jgi:hypothetical protein